jgi:hypothetical protein
MNWYGSCLRLFGEWAGFKVWYKNMPQELIFETAKKWIKDDSLKPPENAL